LRRSEIRQFGSVVQRARRVRSIRVGIRSTVRSVGVGLFQRPCSTVEVNITPRNSDAVHKNIGFVFFSPKTVTVAVPTRAFIDRQIIFDGYRDDEKCFLFSYRYLDFMFEGYNGPILPQDFRVIYRTLASTPPGIGALIEFLTTKLDRIVNEVINGEQVATSIYALLASQVARDDEILKVYTQIYPHGGRFNGCFVHDECPPKSNFQKSLYNTLNNSPPLPTTPLSPVIITNADNRLFSYENSRRLNRYYACV